MTPPQPTRRPAVRSVPGTAATPGPGVPGPNAVSGSPVAEKRVTTPVAMPEDGLRWPPSRTRDWSSTATANPAALAKPPPLAKSLVAMPSPPPKPVSRTPPEVNFATSASRSIWPLATTPPPAVRARLKNWLVSGPGISTWPSPPP